MPLSDWAGNPPIRKNREFDPAGSTLPLASMGVTVIPVSGTSPVGKASDTTPVIRTTLAGLNVAPTIVRSKVRSMADTFWLRTRLSVEAATWFGTCVETTCGPTMATGREPTAYGRRNGTSACVGFGMANPSGVWRMPATEVGRSFSVPLAFWSMKLPVVNPTDRVCPWMVSDQSLRTPVSPDARSVTVRVQFPAGLACGYRRNGWTGAYDPVYGPTSGLVAMVSGTPSPLLSGAVSSNTVPTKFAPSASPWLTRVIVCPVGDVRVSWRSLTFEWVMSTWTVTAPMTTPPPNAPGGTLMVVTVGAGVPVKSWIWSGPAMWVKVWGGPASVNVTPGPLTRSWMRAVVPTTCDPIR